MVIDRKQNGGVSAARNTLLKHATGEYLVFVDPDDYVAPDFVSFLYDLIVKHGADIASCGAINLLPSGKQIKSDADGRFFRMDRKEAMERMCYNNGFFITLWDKIYKRSLFDGLRFPEGKLFEDTRLSPVIASRANVLVAHLEPKYFYVSVPDSITTSTFRTSKFDYVEMSDEVAQFICHTFPDLKQAARRKQLHACLSTLTQMVNSNYRNRSEERFLLSRIHALQWGVFFDPKAPMRDRMAIASLWCGYPMFRFAWRWYRKVRKGA